jgi:hypothetical protein
MKENLNKITEIYAKKPVKANPIGSSKLIEPIYSDTIDERVQLPELNKLSIGGMIPEYQGMGNRSNSTLNQNPQYSSVGKQKKSSKPYNIRNSRNSGLNEDGKYPKTHSQDSNKNKVKNISK